MPVLILSKSYHCLQTQRDLCRMVNKSLLEERGNAGTHLSDQKLTEIATELNCPSPVDNSTHIVIGSMKNYLRKARMFERVARRITFFLKRASLNSKKSFSPPAFMGLPNRSFMRYKRNIKQDPQLNETLSTSKAKSSRSSSKTFSTKCSARSSWPDLPVPGR